MNHDNIVSFNLPNLITIGLMCLIMGSAVALGMKGYKSVKGN